MVEEAGDDIYSLQSFAGKRGTSKDEKPYVRLHNLSTKKQEYIFELKRLMDKEQQLMELKQCTFRPHLYTSRTNHTPSNQLEMSESQRRGYEKTIKRLRDAQLMR